MTTNALMTIAVFAPVALAALTYWLGFETGYHRGIAQGKAWWYEAWNAPGPIEVTYHGQTETIAEDGTCCSTAPQS